MEKLLLRPEEAAELIGVGRTKVYELMRTGQLESVRIGSTRRVPSLALLDYVEGLRMTVEESRLAVDIQLIGRPFSADAKAPYNSRTQRRGRRGWPSSGHVRHPMARAMTCATEPTAGNGPRRSARMTALRPTGRRSSTGTRRSRY